MDKKLCEFLRYNVVEDKNGNRYQVQVCHQDGLGKTYTEKEVQKMGGGTL